MFAHRRVRPKPLAFVCQRLLDELQHRVLVEASSAQIGGLPGPHLDLAGRIGIVGSHAGIGQASQSLGPMLRVDDLEQLFAALEALERKRHEDAVLLLEIAEERTGVTGVPQGASGQVDTQGIGRQIVGSGHTSSQVRKDSKGGSALW